MDPWQEGFNQSYNAWEGDTTTAQSNPWQQGFDQSYQAWQPSDQTQQQPQPQPYQPPSSDIWSALTGVVSGAAGATKEQNPVVDYGNNLWNSIVQPWQAPATPDKQGMNPFEWVGNTASDWADAAGRGIQSTFGGMGAAFSPAGGLVDVAADSGAPVVSQAAQLLRANWEQGVEPLANLFTGTIGEAAHGTNQFLGDAWNDVTSGQFGKLPGDFANDWTGSISKQPLVQLGYMATHPEAVAQMNQYRDQLIEKERENLIAQGYSGADLDRRLQRTVEKTMNPVTMAEQMALQDFGDLPLPEQFALSFFEKLNPGLKVYGTAIHPIQAGAGLALKETGKGAAAVAGGLADATGTRPFFDKIGNAIEGPQLAEKKFTDQGERLQALFTNAEAVTKDVERAREAVLLDPESGFYYKDFGIDEKYAQRAIDYMSLSDQKGRAAELTPDEVQQARVEQDTTPGAEATLSKPPEMPKPGEAPVKDLPTLQAEHDAAREAYVNELTRVNEAAGNPVMKVDEAGKEITDLTPGRLVHADGTPVTDQAVLDAQAELNLAQRALKDATDRANAPDYFASNRADTPQQAFARQRDSAIDDYVNKRVGDLTEGKSITNSIDEKPFRDQALKEAEQFRDKLKTPEDVNSFRTDYLPSQAKLGSLVKSDATLENSFTKSFPRRPVELIDRDRAVGIPDKGATHGDFLAAVTKSLAFDRGAYRFAEGTKVGNPKLRASKPLEQLGAVGKVFRGLNKTMPYLSRSFLNKQGRAFRDSLSNVLKYAAEGFGLLNKKEADRFARVRSSAETRSMGRASAAADVEGKPANNFITNLIFHVINPFDELSSDILRGVTKIKDWNEFTEKAEGAMKVAAYKRTFLKLYDKAIDDRLRAEALDPVIAKALKDGRLTEAFLADYVKGKLSRGANLEDEAKKLYNPQNYTDALRKRYEKLFGDEAGHIGKVVMDELNHISDRVVEYNKRITAEYEKKLADYKRRGKPKDDKEAAAQAATLAALYNRPITINDVVPGHPVWEEMKRDIFAKLDTANTTASVQESLDPAIRAAVRNQFLTSMAWVKDQGKLEAMRRAVNIRIANREEYYRKYEANRVAPNAPQPAPRPGPAEPQLRGRIQNEIAKFMQDTRYKTVGGAALDIINGHKNAVPGNVVFRRIAEDGLPHFRTGKPDDIQKDYVQVWPPKQPEALNFGVPKTEAERLYQEARKAGYGETHTRAAMSILSAFAETWARDHNAHPEDFYKTISIEKGGPIVKDALAQTADRRHEIESGRKTRGETSAVPSPAEIPGVRNARTEELSRRALRDYEDLQHGGPAIGRAAQIKRFVEDARQEIDYQLSLPDRRSGKTWYSTVWKEAMDKVREVFPEMKTDKDSERLFKLFTGLTSQGTKVEPNMTKAVQAFQRYAESGRVRATKADAAPFDQQALGLNHRTLADAKTILEGKRDWTDLSLFSDRLARAKSDEKNSVKAAIETEGKNWLKQDGIRVHKSVIPQLRDLLASRMFYRDTPRAFDWLTQDHDKAAIKSVYAAMVNDSGVSEVFDRMLDVEYPGAARVPGTRVLGPTPKAFGVESPNFLKLADITKKAFGGNLKETIDWLTTKHSIEEFRPIAEILNDGDRTKVTAFLTQVGQAARDDAAYHIDLGDVPENYAGMEYGSRIFGPKIGNFVANLFGAEDRTTKDLWFVTTWNRLMGNVEGVDAVFKEQPTTLQRPIMDAAMAELMKQYRAEGKDITMPQAQALLWFYEKQLAEAHGRGESSEDYSSVADKAIASAERFGKFKSGRPTPEHYQPVDQEFAAADTRDRQAHDAMMNEPLLPQEGAGQRVLGTTQILEDGKYLVSLFDHANASTLPHEFAHIFRHYLDPGLLSAAEEWAGVKDGKWEVVHEEKFARGFEKYLRAGTAPTEGLKAVFAQFKGWLEKLYKVLKGGALENIDSVKIKPVFDRMLGGDAEASVAKSEKAAKPKAAPAQEQEMGYGPGQKVPFDAFLMDRHYDMENGSNAEYQALKAEWDKLGSQPAATTQPTTGIKLDNLEKQQPDVKERIGATSIIYHLQSDGKGTEYKLISDWTGKRGDIPPIDQMRWTLVGNARKPLAEGINLAEPDYLENLENLINNQPKARPTTRLATPAEKAQVKSPGAPPASKLDPDLQARQDALQTELAGRPFTAYALGKDYKRLAEEDLYIRNEQRARIGIDKRPLTKTSPAMAEMPLPNLPAPELPRPASMPEAAKKPRAKLGKVDNIDTHGLKPEITVWNAGMGSRATIPITSNGKPTNYAWRFDRSHGQIGTEYPDFVPWNDAKTGWRVVDTRTGKPINLGKGYFQSYDLTRVAREAIAKDQAAEPKTLKQEETVPSDLESYRQRLLTPPANTKITIPHIGEGTVRSLTALKGIARRWNLPGVLDEMGNDLTGGLGKKDKTQVVKDILATDEYIRQVTNNTFKLDTDTMSAVRRADGKSLEELMGEAKPQPIGEPAPKWPEGDPPNDPAKVVEETRKYFGKNADKAFAEIEKDEGKHAVDLTYAELAKRYGFPDPTDVQTPTGKTGLETDQARLAVRELENDAIQRYNSAATRTVEATNAQIKQDELAKQIATSVRSIQAHAQLEADDGAYKKVEGTYFDYRNKNVIDQMLGSLLPFNYWSRRNFAYLARYFATNPVQFAAVLQLYKNIEQQNKDAGGIAPWNMANMLVWSNPDGSKVQWNGSSMIPFNPLGNSDAFLQLIDANDDEQGDTVNKTPLAMLFGADRKYHGKVTGRDKGIIPTFLTPNPLINIFTQTGLLNDWMKNIGAVTDGFGSPDPSDKRAQRMTVGLVSGRTQIRDIAARTGLTKFIRDQLTKAGINFSDLDFEGPIDNLLFGLNAGKPLTSVYNELTEMAQGDPKNQEKYLWALQKLKTGNWTPEALKALDTVDSQGAWQRMASMAGFVSVVNNTPREQLNAQLGKTYGEVKDDKGHYITTSVDPKTGYETKKFVPGASQDFFDKNAGASVAFDKNKTPDQITEAIGNDRTSKALADLNHSYYDLHKMDLRTFNKLMDDLRKGNPTFFAVNKDKDYQQSKGELPYLPGEKHLTPAEVDTKYAKIENPAERSYTEFKDELYKAGGSGRYSELAQKSSELYNSGQKQASYNLSHSAEYVALKAAEDRVKKAYPKEAERYAAETKAKYPNSGSSSSSTSTGSSSYTARKPFVPYTTSRSSSSASSSSSTFTAAQKRVYAQTLAAGGTKAEATAAAKASLSTTKASSSFTKASNSTTPKATPATAGTSASTWDSVQKKAYALALADGYTKAYATTVANRIGTGESLSYKSKSTGAVAAYAPGQRPNTTASTTPAKTAASTTAVAKATPKATIANANSSGYTNLVLPGATPVQHRGGGGGGKPKAPTSAVHKLGAPWKVPAATSGSLNRFVKRRRY